MKRSEQPGIDRADAADLRRRLARLRSRVAGESRPQALLVIDEAIQEAGAQDRKAG